jgi:predicted ATP-grasp superfamily ATP-dependent carboligase
MTVRPSVAVAGASRPGTLVVVGASVRAFACSALRAGWTVHTADLFTDVDLRAAAATAIRVTGGGPRGYPRGLVHAVAEFPPAPWCYTGALENHPDLLAALAAARPLAGNGATTVRAVRDHARLAEALREAGLAFPPTVASPRGLPTDGSFLMKPRRSAGGRGIRPWRGGPVPRDHVWQRRVSGRPWSLAFLCANGRGRPWSVSGQLVGVPWCHARPFAYCGSTAIHPATLPPRLLRDAHCLGEVLAGRFGLVGLVGADVMIDAAGGMHVIEINPRPTASMELGERTHGGSLAADHLAACGLASPVAAATAGPAGDSATWAKAVLFAPTALRLTPARAGRLADRAAAWTAADGWRALADIPDPRAYLPAGGPVVTLFARGATAAASRRRLRERAREVLEILFSPPSGAAATRRPRSPGNTA